MTWLGTANWVIKWSRFMRENDKVLLLVSIFNWSKMWAYSMKCLAACVGLIMDIFEIVHERNNLNKVYVSKFRI